MDVTKTYYTNIRKDLIAMISSEPEMVLEIGGGEFDTLKFIINKYKCDGVGIDIRIPENYKDSDFELIIGDLDELELFNRLPDNSFDLIIAGDVLEHTKHPDKIISILYTKLRNKGEFILSVPNVRNIKLFFQVFIKGRFPRNDSGLFDRTHLRWFTSKDIKEICVNQRFVVKEYRPLGRISKLGFKSKSLITEFCALQHGLRVVKS